jgi:hypothetical protein
MQYPEFYEAIPTIKLQDELSEFLGAFEAGQIEFSYLDVIKSAGHSCPTVLGAYLMTYKALKSLFPEELPKRGNIKVEFKEMATEGVAGVIANVITTITGATTNYGFKGIAGNFDRRHLMFFEREIEGNARFTRRDTGESVDVIYNPSLIIPNEKMPALMQKCVSRTASEDEQKEFGRLWQDRVERIAQSCDDVIAVNRV